VSTTPVLCSFPVGTDFDKTLQLTVDGVSPITSYQNTDTLSADFWPGADQPAYGTAPTVAWVDASTAQFSVSFLAATTSALDIGQHSVRVKATRAGRTTVIAEFKVELTPSPGSAASLKTYCSYADLLKYAPWVDKLQSSQDQAGFLRERNDARLWFEDLLHRHWRGGQGLSPDYYFLPGIAFGGTNFGRYATVYRSGVRSSQLQTWLDSGGQDGGDGLMVTSQVIEAVACYAISRIAQNQFAPGKESTYHAFAVLFGERAESAASLITAELDTNGDGLTDTYVRLGIADTLDG
jgi:hypothetical protein